MKRKDLLKRLHKIGGQFVRHGGNHDWYKNPATGKGQPVPRHILRLFNTQRHTAAIDPINSAAALEMSRSMTRGEKKDKLYKTREIYNRTRI